MWKVLDKGDYLLYVFEEIDLQIKVFDKQAYSEIYINYKGYNIAFSMGFWGFGYECQNRNIHTSLHGDAVKHQDDMYFTVQKKDERGFVDLIFFFLVESYADGMLGEDSRIKNW